MTQRMEEINDFVALAGWGDASAVLLAGDASNRRYLRLTRPSGSRVVLMDAAPPSGENVRQFVEFAARLRGYGLSAPDVYAKDLNAGLLLIEDLGDALFARVLQSDPGRELEFYEAAMDVLAHLHRQDAPEGTAQTSEKSAAFVSPAYDWYLEGMTRRPGTAAFDRCLQELTPQLAAFDEELNVLVLRDYHAENLLWLPERTGVARVGLLDFQDAIRGHAAYDVVSILQDARRDVPPAIEAEMKARYIRVTGHDASRFETAYAVFGLQRNLRILGIFARLCLRDGKMQYVDFIPRVWGHVQTNLRHPELRNMAQLIDKDLPEPSAELLNRLKEKSGSWAGR